MSSSDKNLRDEYPSELVKSGERGKYARRFREEGTNLVRIDPDLLRLFPDADAVNRALREYAEERKKSVI